MIRRFSQALRFAPFLLVLLGAGCATSGMGRYDVHVTMDDSLADSRGVLPSVEIHLIGMDAARGRMLQAVSMTEYWDPNRKRDAYAKSVMCFGARQPRVQVFSKNDPLWRRWQAEGASYLFVLADLQGIREDRQDVEDPRRMILPLDRTQWQNNNIHIMIEEAGLFCLTQRQKAKSK